MQYITLDANNKITAVADWQFPGSVPAREEVVRTEEGQFVFKSALDEAHEQAIRDQRELDAKKHEILTALDALDAKGARAARAVALATSKGEAPAGADVEKLAVLEEEAQALRAELAELQ